MNFKGLTRKKLTLNGGQLLTDPVVKEQCRMMSAVSSSPTPLSGGLSVVGVGE